MTLLLEYREKIKNFYRLNSAMILPVLKFMIAFFALNGVNTLMGYEPKLDNVAIVLIASLACSFLPAAFLTLLCAVLSLWHMYALSLEVAAVGLCVYLILFLLLFRFCPKDSYVIILTALMLSMKLPYIIPIAVGLTGAPLSAVSVACGVIVYYVLTTITGCGPAVWALGDDMAGKVKLLVESLMANRTMLVMAGAFAVTVVVVYMIRRMSVEYAWSIAMIAGIMVNLVILLVGSLVYDIDFSILSGILGSVLALGVGKVIEFFRFLVDYSRTEHVQFEDDEYYYYVKAVPKMNIAEPAKTVKRINTPSHSSQMGETRPMPPVSREEVRTRSMPQRSGTRPDGQAPAQRSAGQGMAARRMPGSGDTQQGARPGTQSPKTPGSQGRSVTMERIPRPQESMQRRTTGHSSGGVTVGSTAGAAKATEDGDDYEELF